MKEESNSVEITATATGSYYTTVEKLFNSPEVKDFITELAEMEINAEGELEKISEATVTSIPG